MDGWISDRRRRTGGDATSVGFAFELEGTNVGKFHLLVHEQVLPFPEVKTLEDAVRKLQVAVKIARDESSSQPQPLSDLEGPGLTPQ